MRTELLTDTEAARLLNVSEDLVRSWIEAERLACLDLPSGGYRIPQGSLLASLRANYDLPGELRMLDERYAELSDAQVKGALVDG